MITDSEDQRDAKEARSTARLFRVLGEQYLEPPTRGKIENLGIWASEWRCNADSLPPELDESLLAIMEGSNTDEQRLRVAFTHLFRGIDENVGADPPYESLYRDGQLFSSTAREIQRGYESAGFEIDPDKQNELPDHLGIELQYLGELHATIHRDNGLSAERTEDAIRWMIEDHLLEWLPTFREQVRTEDPPMFYEGVVDLTLIAVELQQDRLSENDNY